MEKRKLIRKIDFWLIFGFVVIALAFYSAYNFFNRSMAVKAELVIDGTTVKEISLSEDKIFNLEQAPNITFEVKNGRIRFKQSDCPDKICVKTGFISKTGQMAVCLPNKASIKIVGYKDDIDSAAG